MNKALQENKRALQENKRALQDKDIALATIQKNSVIALLQSGQLPSFISSALNVTPEYIRTVVADDSIVLSEQQSVDL